MRINELAEQDGHICREGDHPEPQKRQQQHFHICREGDALEPTEEAAAPPPKQRRGQNT